MDVLLVAFNIIIYILIHLIIDSVYFDLILLKKKKKSQKSLSPYSVSYQTVYVF